MPTTLNKNKRAVLLASLFAALAPAVARAADTPPPPPSAPAKPADPLAGAREHIQAKRWAAAMGELQRVNAGNNADWNNLMGYVLRKQATPDLDGAQRHYDAALRINPQHRGALEYSGELALMRGNLPQAEERLASLGRVCSSNCEELDDLKKGIERYKANGNRYTP